MQQPGHATALRQQCPDRPRSAARWAESPTDVQVAELLYAVAGAAPPTTVTATATATADLWVRWRRSGRRPVGFAPDPLTPDIDAFIIRLEQSLAADRRSQAAEAVIRELLKFVQFMRGDEAFSYTPIQRALNLPQWTGASWHLLALHTGRVVGEAYIAAGVWPNLRGKRRLLARLVHALMACSGVSYSVDTVLEVLTERQRDYEVWRSER